MPALLFVEQVLNGLQFGVMLFLMAAGLTLVFGIMRLINLAHGSFYMVGAYLCALAAEASGSFLLGLLAGLAGAALVGAAVEFLVIRRLYDRDHLDQVLATFGLILFFNELVKILFGPRPLLLDPPALLSGAVELLPGLPYPAYRLAIIGVGIAVALGLYLLIRHSRLGMVIRAGATHREIVAALGVNIRLVYTLVFGLGALLAGLAGATIGPLLSVQIGMGEEILILTFVVIVIGGIGSIKGALVGALLVGVTDTLARVLLPLVFGAFLEPSAAAGVAASLASMMIYVVMALVLVWRPHGLFPAEGA